MPTALPDVPDDPLDDLLSELGVRSTAPGAALPAVHDDPVTGLLSELGVRSTAPGAARPPVADSTPAAKDAPPAAPQDGWNGELDHLDKAPWWGSVPAPAQAAFRAGYEAKIKNLEKGYQEKYRSAAEERKAVEAERQRVKAETERAELLASIAGQDPSKLRAVYAELAELRQVRDTYQAREQERLQSSYGDIIAHEPAVTLFASLLDSGVDEAAAAAFARQQHGLVKAPAPAAQPAAAPPAPTGGPRSTSSVDAWQRASGQIGKGDDPPARRGGESWRPGMSIDDLLESASHAAAAKLGRR